MMKLTFAMFLSLVLLLTACERQPDEDELHEAAARVEHADLDEKQQYSESGEYLVKIMSTPDPIPLEEEFTLTVTIRDSAGLALDDAKDVRVDGFMPAHGHGMNTEPHVRALGEGRYQADGMSFSMPGEWEVYVDVVTGETVERTTFEYLMKE